MHWIHENYVCPNCVRKPNNKCCNNIDDATANFCTPDSPQGNNVTDHISQGKKIIIASIRDKNITNPKNGCLDLYYIVSNF